MPKVVASARFASLADQQLSGSKPLRASDLMASELSLDSPVKDRIFGRNRNSQNSFQIMPTNYELELMNYQNETGEVKSLFDFTSKNIGDLKSFKIGKLQQCKQRIEEVHATLRRRKGLGDELL